MQLEDRYDFVSVHNVYHLGTRNMLGKWSGRDLPPSVKSTSNRLLIAMRTDGSVAHKGFAANFDTMRACPIVFLESANSKRDPGKGFTITNRYLQITPEELGKVDPAKIKAPRKAMLVNVSLKRAIAVFCNYGEATNMDAYFGQCILKCLKSDLLEEAVSQSIMNGDAVLIEANDGKETQKQRMDPVSKTISYVQFMPFGNVGSAAVVALVDPWFMVH
ncbi:hypothetical protein X801_01971 [Opisthorchis viverrini]|uniref:CUB domain-containing protein n=1 Tax=Opisthorchis viverrini TaxID=6198 RepID=A0A1S8X607_OPIVI|nr:hypothetical protein X801_01971 [Opisthorchis viverrini]